jgi:hypothetical protein
MFKFWLDCRYKPCRSARLCSGDHGACLRSRWQSVSHEAGVAAHERMTAGTPPDADRFARMAHHYPHHSLCLHDPKNQKTRAKTESKTKAKTEDGFQPGRSRDDAPRLSRNA